jgi:hypothetical protein
MSPTGLAGTPDLVFSVSIFGRPMEMLFFLRVGGGIGSCLRIAGSSVGLALADVFHTDCLNA